MPSNDCMVSVIMPAYNVEKFIARAIDSILAQTHNNLELLVSDDGSTDTTKSIIGSYTDQRIKAFHNAENKGNLTTWNDLISKTSGDYIILQDADDWSDPRRIELLVEEFRKDPELKMISSAFHSVDESGKTISTCSYEGSYTELKNKLPNEFPFHCPTIMISADQYKKYGGLDPYFDRAGAADWYWGAKILLNGKAACYNRPLYYYRIHRNSFTKSLNKNIRVYYSEEIVKHLIAQRISTGTDDLEQKKFRKLALFEAPFQIKYLLWQEKYKEAFIKAFGLIFRAPFQPISFYKNLYIYLRKFIRIKLTGRRAAVSGIPE